MTIPTIRHCPHCYRPNSISRRMHGDRVRCSYCGNWSAVVMFPDRTELRKCDPPDGSTSARETTEAAALMAELQATRAELVTTREDNAVLLAVLRDIDMSRDELPERVQRLLDRIQQAEHPGRALMGELTRRLDDLERERDAAREKCATVADEVADKHQQIGAQGRFTVDYRQGAIDAARHVAHLIRKSIE